MGKYIYEMFEAVSSTSSFKSNEPTKLVVLEEVRADSSTLAVDKFKRLHPSYKDRTVLAYQNREFCGFR